MAVSLLGPPSALDWSPRCPSSPVGRTAALCGPAATSFWFLLRWTQKSPGTKISFGHGWIQMLLVYSPSPAAPAAGESASLFWPKPRAVFHQLSLGIASPPKPTTAASAAWTGDVGQT